MTFAINTEQAKRWWLKPLKVINTLPVDPHNPMAVKSLIRCLREGKRVMIFPEGRVTTTGNLMKMYEGPGLIAAKTGAAIIPPCIEGAQYSFFSYLKGKVRLRLFPKIKLTFSEPRKINVPENFSARKRRQHISEKIYRIMTNTLLNSYDKTSTLFELLKDASKIHGKSKVIIQDINNNDLSYRSLITKTYVMAQLLKRK